MAGIMTCWNEVSKFLAERRKGLTLNLGYNVGHPYASCYRYDDLLLAPYCDTSGAHERLIPEKIPGSRNRTYTRSTIKREAAATARYPKIWK
jgi:hypothetical protein